MNFILYILEVLLFNSKVINWLNQKFAGKKFHII